MADVTVPAAILAGVLSFLSPCVLPVVPAYLGQLGAAEAAARTALGRSLAFVAGFGGVFTLLGATATYAGRFVAPYLPELRQVGGVVLIVLGLHLAGLVRVPALARTWRPLDRAARGLPGGIGLVREMPGLVGSFGLGAAFALGWTPCIGPTLGAIFGLAALGDGEQAAVLFGAYSAGLGIPFVALALALDRADGIIRLLRRFARPVEIAGGGLVVLTGLALLFGWLPWIAARFGSLVPAI